MNETPVYDLKGLDKEDLNRILDAASEDCHWMLSVYSPRKDTHHVLCLWFQDAEPSEFRDLLQHLALPEQDAAVLAKLYAADYALHNSDIEIMGELARAFRVEATKVLNL